MTGDAVPLLVVGAHLDDAVLSCGRLLAAAPGSVVCTVFAGRPGPDAPARPGETAWDVRCGFAPGDDVVGARHAEDDAALAVLAARPVRLGFVDAQYGPPPAVDDVAAALARVVAEVRAARVLVPLGLFHRDHRWTAAAWLRVLRTGGAGPAPWAVHVDAPYRAWAPVRQRLAALARTGVRLGPPDVTTDADVGPAAADRRRRALDAYVSQRVGLADLGSRAAAAAPLPPAPGADGDVVHAVLGAVPGAGSTPGPGCDGDRPRDARLDR
ncbi:PIG-L family deacetylase [Kineosporia sp. R_H_3]|uniref:PIG-L family deacetylase n=1 Tax=Kineosporia sp. R_H_3 TaxID=1961848 RepID=UPI000B4C05D7|nr:PIG-L family deacetylase [Kineosporia sp. R_H_3]